MRRNLGYEIKTLARMMKQCIDATEFMKTNNRPKKVLNYKTPTNLFEQELQKCCT